MRSTGLMCGIGGCEGARSSWFMGEGSIVATLRLTITASPSLEAFIGALHKSSRLCMVYRFPSSVSCSDRILWAALTSAEHEETTGTSSSLPISTGKCQRPARPWTRLTHITWDGSPGSRLDGTSFTTASWSYHARVVETKACEAHFSPLDLLLQSDT